MQFELIVNIYLKENLASEAKRIIKEAFNHELTEYPLPFTDEIRSAIEQRGHFFSYKIEYHSETIKTAVFDLLEQVDNLGYDWKVRGPLKTDSKNYLFAASLFPEFGKFNNPLILGLTLFIEEK